jgi:hypothetical protein
MQVILLRTFPLQTNFRQETLSPYCRTVRVCVCVCVHVCGYRKSELFGHVASHFDNNETYAEIDIKTRTADQTNGKDDGLHNVENLILCRRQTEPNKVGIRFGGNVNIKRNAGNHGVQHDLPNSTTLHDDPKVAEDLSNRAAHLHLVFLQHDIARHADNVNGGNEPGELWNLYIYIYI